MSWELSAFVPVEGLKDVFTAQKGGLRCTAIRLSSGDLCLYSPVAGLGPVARDSLKALGQVTLLLAPNHYHHKGLGEYRAAFPKAGLCCTAAARPRLEKQAGLSFQRLDEIAPTLAENAALVEPDGLKTGEVWLRMSTEKGTVWIVTDAFCGAKGTVGAVVDEPALLGTFPRFGIADRETYRDWLSKEIGDRPPIMMVPCHGSIIAGEQIAARALQLVLGIA